MDRSLGKWKLPQPTDLKDEDKKEWIQIPRIARTVPFGYKINENDRELLDPIPYELEALELARRHVKQYSLRQVANWLTTKTCLLYTSPSPRDLSTSRMPSSA